MFECPTGFFILFFSLKCILFINFLINAGQFIIRNHVRLSSKLFELQYIRVSSALYSPRYFEQKVEIQSSLY